VDEAFIRDTLLRYADVEERARETAEVVYRVRFPRDYGMSFDVEFSDDHRTVHAHYFFRQNTHTLSFPVLYLCESEPLVRELESQRMQAEQLAHERERQLREATEEAERETIERRTYERLKKKYEGDVDGRPPKRTGSKRPSDAT